jgi:lipid-binding SYLF domain-containing protein
MIAGIAGLTGVVGGCASPSGQTTSERQSSTLLMRDQALARLEREHPDAKASLQNAAGYAVFQTIAMGALVGGSNGFGVAEARTTGKQTFMRMSSNSLNAGVSAQENRLVLIFRDQAAFDRFVAGNWQWGGSASAGVSTSSGGGGTGNNAGASTDGVTVYQMTSSGFALTANLGAARFWPDANM